MAWKCRDGVRSLCRRALPVWPRQRGSFQRLRPTIPATRPTCSNPPQRLAVDQGQALMGDTVDANTVSVFAHEISGEHIIFDVAVIIDQLKLQHDRPASAGSQRCIEFGEHT